jgi:hypothetical protein
VPDCWTQNYTKTIPHVVVIRTSLTRRNRLNSTSSSPRYPREETLPVSTGTIKPTCHGRSTSIRVVLSTPLAPTRPSGQIQALTVQGERKKFNPGILLFFPTLTMSASKCRIAVARAHTVCATVYRQLKLSEPWELHLQRLMKIIAVIFIEVLYLYPTYQTDLGCTSQSRGVVMITLKKIESGYAVRDFGEPGPLTFPTKTSGRGVTLETKRPTQTMLLLFLFFFFFPYCHLPVPFYDRETKCLL